MADLWAEYVECVDGLRDSYEHKRHMLTDERCFQEWCEERAEQQKRDSLRQTHRTREGGEMSKRTPGPWITTSVDHGPNGREYFIQNKNGDPVAGGSDHIRAADAELIAAAPEPLAELRFLIENCVETVEREYADGSPYEEEVIRADPATLKRIRAAIARAEGK